MRRRRLILAAGAFVVFLGAVAHLFGAHAFLLLSPSSSTPPATKNGKIVNISSGTGAIVNLGTGAIVAVTE